MSGDDAGFDAVGWVARSLAWERRLRELEDTGVPEEPSEPPLAAEVEVASAAGFAYLRLRLAAGPSIDLRNQTNHVE